MHALEFRFSFPRYIIGKAIGWALPSVYWSGIS